MNFENNDNLDYQLNKVASMVIKEKRIQKGYSLDDVVNKLNNIITKQSLYRYENNEARMKNKIFKKICLALNENPSEVWQEINDKFLYGLSFMTNTKVPTKKTQIPILKTIKPNIPIETQQNIIEYIDIPKKWTLKNKEFFGLKINEESMIPKYNINDIVIFEKISDLTQVNNKDCLVIVNNEVTFKKVLLNETGIILVPYNTNLYDMKIYAEKEIKIIGIAIEKRTKI